MDTSLLPNEDGVITLIGGEFGWEWARYNDATTKANYASVETSGVQREVLMEVLMEQTGAKEIEFLASDDYNSEYHSYIDHESCGNLGGVSSKEELKNWIFNPNCWLITGNDNSSAPNNMFDFPRTDENGVQHPVAYTHEIKAKGFENKAKFAGYPSEEKIGEALDILLQDSKFDENGELVKSNGWFSSSDNYYEFRTWKVDNYIKPFNVEEEYFVVFADYKLNTEVDRLYKESQKRVFEKAIITEKSDPKGNEENPWKKRKEIEDNLLKNKIDSFIIKIKFEIVEIK